MSYAFNFTGINNIEELNKALNREHIISTQNAHPHAWIIIQWNPNGQLGFVAKYCEDRHARKEDGMIFGSCDGCVIPGLPMLAQPHLCLPNDVYWDIRNYIVASYFHFQEQLILAK